MTAKEFEEWRVFFAIEDLHPRAGVRRHYELMAAVHSGPLKHPRGKNRVWRASDLRKPDPWELPSPKRPPPSAADVAAQVASINASRRRRH